MAIERSIIAELKRAYYELYVVRQAIQVTDEERPLLVDIRDIANTRYRAGQTSQQDVLRADLIDNWRQLLQYEVGYLRLEASLRQTLAELERVVGGLADRLE